MNLYSTKIYILILKFISLILKTYNLYKINSFMLSNCLVFRTVLNVVRVYIIASSVKLYLTLITINANSLSFSNKPCFIFSSLFLWTVYR